MAGTSRVNNPSSGGSVLGFHCECSITGGCTSDEDRLESAHAGGQGMDDVHRNGSIIDMGRGINNFFVDLVSEIH